MGDTTDGSSNAAQSAQSDTTQHLQRGFFDRIVEAFSHSDMSQTKASEANGHAVAPARPGLANLRRMRVEDVMIPKAEIVAVPQDISKEEMVKVFRDSGYTRLPVYDGTLDTPVGFANLKDLALTHGFDCDSDTFDLRALLRALLFVPPSMPLGVLLQKMQSERTHMALVIDEYGGTDGLLTIEDLLEQVVGEIEDEHDTDETVPWKPEQPGVYMVEARAPLDEFEAEIGRPLTGHEEIDQDEVDTLGGLVFMLAGHVPARGEVIPHPDGPEFEVVEADPRRIKRLRVRLHGREGG
ncbi:hemolysin family protein [Roseovarius sp. SYSU LYC5161]|uniref:hemolysin family protein n=1 Tax=Roseovarius halophilus (ex Wu et al. 2025) TaxID=3376060 RepID=UPI00399C3D19